MDFLKLLALDIEDLAVISAHLQDAQVRVEDIAYIPEKKRFVFAACRQMKELASPSVACYSGIHFDFVTAVRLRHIDQNKKDDILTLIGILFETDNPPSGKATFLFKDDKNIQLDIECIEAHLRDFPMRENY